jgi:putative hydrolases of HD superfamily
MKKQYAKYLYEIGQLKLVKRSGWWLAGITDPESVAEHSFRTAHIGFILAIMEGADPGETVMMCLFHDIHESRMTDLHKVSQAYLDKKDAESRITEDQAGFLTEQAGGRMAELIRKMERNDTLEAALAHDADALECLIQACEYRSRGYQDVQDWIDSSLNKLKSQTAHEIARDCLDNPPSSWWQNLKSE